MNFKNYTLKSQEAIQQAQQIATSFNHQAIENGHILKAISEVDENVTPFLLKKLGVNYKNVIQAIDRIIDSYPSVTGGNQYLSKTANQSLNHASNYLKQFEDEYVSIEHLILGILKSGELLLEHLKDKKSLNDTITRLFIIPKYDHSIKLSTAAFENLKNDQQIN